MPILARFATLATLGALALAALEPAPARAETQAPAGATAGQGTEAVRALQDLLQLDGLMEVMVLEGLDYGASIEEQMFPGRGGARWEATVRAIYAPEPMRVLFDTAFAQAIAEDEAAIAAAAAFYGSDLGRRILTLEIEARRALLDPAVEEAAAVEAERMQADRDPRLRQIRSLIEAGDLIEMNVAGALSANLAFFTGMAEVGPGPAVPQEDLMAEVWGQEADIRSEVANWLVPYMALSYGPLSDAELQDYVDFYASDEGKRVNAALFAGFDAVFRKVSQDLGRAAAGLMQGSDI
jgi:hypothetical protein